MQSMVGKYKLYKNENTEDYFIAVAIFYVPLPWKGIVMRFHGEKPGLETVYVYRGVPYIGRRMIAMSSPVMEISVEGDVWTIRTITLLRTIEAKFTLGQEYEEHMPNATIKSVSQQEGDELVTSSVLPRTGLRTTRRYTFTHDQCVVTMTHERLTTSARRYFRRIKE